VAKGKDKKESGILSLFKGKEARLNRAIFHILALKGPQPVYTLLGEIRKQRGFTDTRYGVVRRRVEALEKQDYLIKVGTAKTRWGYDTPLYSLTPRAELAMILSKTDMDRFVKEADYHRLISMLDAFKSS
jgi:hypothetical protein